MRQFLVFVAGVLCLLVLQSGTPDNVVFTNVGRMNVAPNNDNVTLYIPSAMLHKNTTAVDSVSVILNGKLALGGNFYHDSDTRVFAVEGNLNITMSTGSMMFVNNNGVSRVISTYDNDINGFDRTYTAIAFPNILISTNDTIFIPGKMGIDAITCKRTPANTGVLVLRSEELANKVFNASLRFPFPGNSSDLIQSGLVIVEQYVNTYRSGTQLFAFATPFKNTQLSGYFAGNWVRRPIADGLNGHTTYVLGNRPSSANPDIIDLSQYVTDPIQVLSSGQAYLIKPRPIGFDYSQLKSENGLMLTGALASVYDKEKFIFDGKVYTLTPYNEQVFADDVLFSQTVHASTLSNTVNWVIGNSYTSPISTKLLAKQMEESAIQFSPVIYVYPAGSTSYQPFDITGTSDAINVIDLNEIPSMSIFMLRLKRGQTLNNTTSFSIGKNVLQHGNASHGTQQQVRLNVAKNQLVFRLSPIENANIYDVVAIGVRDSASAGIDKYDVSKVYNVDGDVFQMYTLSANGSKLSINGIPNTTTQVTLSVKPNKANQDYLLSMQDQDICFSNIWLEDLKTSTLTDLRANPQFRFQSSVNDIANRFIIHFDVDGRLKDDDSNEVELIIANEKVRFENLTQDHLNSTLRVYDITGRLVLNSKITLFPVYELQSRLKNGVYFFRIDYGSGLNFKSVI